MKFSTTTFTTLFLTTLVSLSTTEARIGQTDALAAHRRLEEEEAVGDSSGVYTTTVLNKTGKPLFFKIGPAEQPQLCQSTGIVPNPSSTDSGTYTFAGTGGAVLPPLCDMAVLASEACSETLTGDNVQGTINICDLKGGTACQCIYTAGAGHCEPKELCKYCKPGLVTKGPNASTNNKVICVEPTDFSPVYEVGVEQVALITRTGDGSGQRLVASDAPFGWNPFEAEANGQTLFELTFGGNRISYDISLIPSGCDDKPHPGSGWQSQLGWGKQADCSSLPANSISSSCPRCKDNNPPAFNFGGKMTCESGGFPFSCLGPVEGTWSTGNGQGWPTFCGNPDTSCDNFAQPTEQNEGCPQAYFHPRFTPVYGSDKQPTSNCNAFSPITISICDPTKSTCDQLVPDDTNTNCGCPDDCTAAVWNRVVDGYSCGQRITWLQTESARIVGGPFTAQDSCRKVATDEFPNACGPLVHRL